jgi:hypothetical protein
MENKRTIALACCLSVALVFSAACSPTAEEPTGTPEPTQTPVEPVRILLHREGETRVELGTPIELYTGWACASQEQVADYMAAVTFSGSLDGQPLQDMDDYWGEIEPYEGIPGVSEAYVSYWAYPLGVLSPGTYVVEARRTLNWTVTDGFDADGDGLPDEYSGFRDFTIRIIVEE